MDGFTTGSCLLACCAPRLPGSLPLWRRELGITDPVARRAVDPRLASCNRPVYIRCLVDREPARIAPGIVGRRITRGGLNKTVGVRRYSDRYRGEWNGDGTRVGDTEVDGLRRATGNRSLIALMSNSTADEAGVRYPQPLLVEAVLYSPNVLVTVWQSVISPGPTSLLPETKPTRLHLLSKRERGE